MTDPKQLEAEIYESEELSCDLEEKLNHTRNYIGVMFIVGSIKSVYTRKSGIYFISVT
jgi:hypothetical protein